MRAKLRLKPVRIGLFSLVVVALLVPVLAASGSLLWKNKSTANQELAPLSSGLPAGGPQESDILGTSDNPNAVPFSTSASAVSSQGLDIMGSSDNLNAVSLAGTPASSPGESDTITKSEAWDKIDFNSRRLSNNVWGAPADEKMTSGVYRDQDNSFGWYWDRQSPRAKPGINGVLPIYPSVRVGGSPWESSNSVSFPVRVKDVKSFQCNLAYDYPKLPDGLYDLAYDLFFTETDQPSSSPKRNAEVMIWLHQTLAPPTDNYTGDFSDGNNTYGLYSYVMADGRLYFSFIMKSRPLFAARHTVDVARLLDNLDLDPNWYIHGIELGNEVVHGAGRIRISQFNVNLNGHDS